jgi:hypothetical protein
VWFGKVSQVGTTQSAPLTENQIEYIVGLYLDGVGTTAISKIYNRHPSTIQKTLKKAGVLRPKQKYRINDSFFDEFTPESCYWAGMMMADGYVRDGNNLFGMHLGRIDVLHLLKFLSCMDSTHKLIWDKNSEAYCLQVYNPQCRKMLEENFNITPNKTTTATYPINIPYSLHSHFIRGLMDGDGSITYTTCPTLSFLGTIDLLSSVNQIIKQHVNYNMRTKHKLMPSICIPNSLNPWFGSLNFSGETGKQVMDWLYAESDDTIRLERKYDKYQELFYNQHLMENE